VNHIWSGDLKYRRLILQSLASALLSYVGFRFEPAGSPDSVVLFFHHWPGLCFGVLVLAPMASEGSRVWLRRLGLVISSIFVWDTALLVGLGLWARQLVGTVSYSSVGALLICLACRYIIPQRFSLKQILMALLAGGVGGAAIGIIAENWMRSWLSSPGYFWGFIIWQMGVAFALFSDYFSGSDASNEPLRSAQEPPG